MQEAFIQVSVRLIVGLVSAGAGAFFGVLLVAMIFSASDSSDILISTTRLVVISTAAAVSSRLGWFGMIETRTQSISLYLVSAVVGMLGSWLAIAAAGALLDNTDLYILNRDISGAGFLGAVFACNIPSLVFAIKLARNREI